MIKRIIKTIKLIYQYLIFSIAKKKCQRLNRKGTKHIVINYCGKPMILNRKRFRQLREAGVFKRRVKWRDVCKLNYVDYVPKR